MAIGNALGGSSTSGSTSGGGALGGRGGNNNAQRRRQRARARQRRQDQRARGNATSSEGGAPAEDTDTIAPNGFNPATMSSSGSLTAPVSPGSTYGGSNPLDTGTGSNNFNDINNRRESAMGLLHQAGIDSNASRAYGANAVPFLNDMVQGWMDDYEGVALTQNPDLTFENFMYGLPGAEALAGAPGTPAAAPPPTVVEQPLGFKDWRAENVQGNWRNMNKGRRNRIRNKYQTYTDEQAAQANTAVTPGAPGTEQWRNQTWNPAMNAAIRRALARRTPTQRGQELNRWTGNNTTVAFG